METGIYTRAEIEGKLQSVDIGDRRLPDSQLLEWLRKNGGKNVFAERVVFILLGRSQASIE